MINKIFQPRVRFCLLKRHTYKHCENGTGAKCERVARDCGIDGNRGVKQERGRDYQTLLPKVLQEIKMN